jgi:hypothetical protein
MRMRKVFFLTSDELLLPVLKAFAQCSRSLQAVEVLGNFHSVCSSRTVCRTHH